MSSQNYQNFNIWLLLAHVSWPQHTSGSEVSRPSLKRVPGLKLRSWDSHSAPLTEISSHEGWKANGSD